ncbi:fumarylacetoacetate hydrolase family protein [Pseudoclavibacter chungangensis]|uniref:Fumarylacetoacetate hydrolase family protein n=1 Tax=Pseudoclavibacter chungangensis TaxID=587635 RepID=A0A7J5BMT9_9MICO|nr:fumarylacetoacetate hydrolase family protein [Pseudoclavibacter chungangensis]KAB1652863.1 fumarylacetoacetate hydrolase family protein [Pseudoclavibacter chungangensis]NYJ67140.1 2-keto-4-pentenoate hydratase/2-oxohepta-3-ene-1,7-dioic acid hydratase in catechol pathway [Pseudoclavibacter chungangensis]
MSHEDGAAPDTTAFAIGTFTSEAGAFPGFVVDGQVRDIREVLPEIRTTGDLFAEWESNLDALQAVVADPDERARLGGVPVEGVGVLPPVQPIGPILAAGANYREHILQMSVVHKLGRSDATDEELWAEAAAENDERRRSGDPYIWTGIPSAVSGAFDDVQLPDVGDDIDWEVELGVVIGRTAHRVAAEDAYDVVAGYTIVNDITSRTLVPRTDMALIGTDWFRAKNQPTFFPTGPYLVPARFVPDPTALRIQLRLNGEIKQDATTDDLLFDIPSLIAYASSIAILRPGDLLITGSPPGNGSHWKRFLRDGDVMEASITGLGAQRNVVRGPSGTVPPWQASRVSAVS